MIIADRRPASLGTPSLANCYGEAILPVIAV